MTLIALQRGDEIRGQRGKQATVASQVHKAASFGRQHCVPYRFLLRSSAAGNRRRHPLISAILESKSVAKDYFNISQMLRF